MTFDVYTGLRAFLLTDPSGWGLASPAEQARRMAARVALASLIGTRVYPMKFPQTVTYPAVKLQRIAGRLQTVLRGHASLSGAVVQVDAWAREQSGLSSFQVVQQVGRHLRERLEGYSGTFTDASVSPALTVQVGVTLQDERELFATDVDTSGLHGYQADYRIWHGVTGA